MSDTSKVRQELDILVSTQRAYRQFHAASAEASIASGQGDLPRELDATRRMADALVDAVQAAAPAPKAL